VAEPRLFAAIYTDEDITSRLAIALRQRGFEALAAHEAGLVSDTDEAHLIYAAAHQMVLLTCNRDDFIRLAHEWAAAERPHYGIVISPSFQIASLVNCFV
jgi:predicted nuclease of predicted toxin-antitoxin system